MQTSVEQLTQITFHYINGQSESFTIHDAPDANVTWQEVQQEIRRLFDRHWWILHLPEQTVCINTANVLRVEFRPPLPGIHGEGIFTDARRVTALSRHGS